MRREKPDEYFYRVKQWCELLRETWERSIEELLLENGIQRFSYAIETKRLTKAKFNQELMKEVEKGMTETSKYVHDRASGAMVKEAPYSDLEKLMKDFVTFYDKFRSKEK